MNMDRLRSLTSVVYSKKGKLIFYSKVVMGIVFALHALYKVS